MNQTVSISRKEIIRGIVMTLLINGAVPFIVYEVLSSHMSSIAALFIATVIPLIDNLFSFMKRRRLDVFAVFMLISFLLGIVAFTVDGSEKLLLIRESLVTGILGIIFLGSLFFPRPLIFYFAIRFTLGNDPDKTSAFANNWQYSYFRFVLRLITMVWGLCLIGESFVRTILVFKLSVSQFLAVSNFVMYGFMGVAIVFTVVYRRHSQKRFKEIISNGRPV
ncbi:VC0807 family protein [Neobacillus cucumis]|uniref:VC0807 family protein n=1 Tax=Neobacillus cucumis TaxID=1740721 RepID=UPI001963973F|nr:VC0807 family protein [Neobacillus cucumis]MBM7652811.1 putative membrane protein [Neobacillus cucumis]